jgi:hypothetical protein
LRRLLSGGTLASFGCAVESRFSSDWELFRFGYGLRRRRSRTFAIGLRSRRGERFDVRRIRRSVFGNVGVMVNTLVVKKENEYG